MASRSSASSPSSVSGTKKACNARSALRQSEKASAHKASRKSSQR